MELNRNKFDGYFGLEMLELHHFLTTSAGMDIISYGSTDCEVVEVWNRYRLFEGVRAELQIFSLKYQKILSIKY